MNAQLALTDMPLTEAEQMFVYQKEIIGLPIKRAAEVAGVASPYHLIKQPHIIAAMDEAQKVVRARTNFTREDVVAGLYEAIEHAKVINEPMAQIAGWREIARLLNYDKTPNVHLHLTGSADQVAKQLQQMSSEDLLKHLGAEGGSVLDADFYEVKKDGA